MGVPGLWKLMELFRRAIWTVQSIAHAYAILTQERTTHPRTGAGRDANVKRLCTRTPILDPADGR